MNQPVRKIPIKTAVGANKQGFAIEWVPKSALCSRPTAPGRARRDVSGQNATNRSRRRHDVSGLLGNHLPALVKVFQNPNYFPNHLWVSLYVRFKQMPVHKGVKFSKVARYFAAGIHIQHGT